MGSGNKNDNLYPKNKTEKKAWPRRFCNQGTYWKAIETKIRWMTYKWNCLYDRK